jgi:hypothetical protein
MQNEGAIDSRLRGKSLPHKGNDDFEVVGKKECPILADVAAKGGFGVIDPKGSQPWPLTR